MYFHPGQYGYDIYRSIIHQNQITGLLHALFMPIACVGFFYCVIAVFNKTVAKMLLRAFLALMLMGWLTFQPIAGIITAIYYYLINNYCISSAKDMSTKNRLGLGVLLLIISIGMMEFVGHWALEGHGSNLLHFLNSVYHTPLYGTLSVRDAISGFIEF